MKENITDRMSSVPPRHEEFKKVTNFDELNVRLAAFDARLSDLETRMYKRGWELRQLEADHDELVEHHKRLVKVHNDGWRDTEREIQDIRETLALLTGKAAPEQSAFQAQLDRVFQRKTDEDLS